MDKNRKTMMIVAGVAVLAYLLYRYYQNAQASTAGTAATTSQTGTASDYAALAGQEQSDVAGLQSQEQSDVNNLMGDFTTLSGQVTANQTQEQSDVTGLTGVITTLSGTVSGLATTVAGLGANSGAPAGSTTTASTAQGSTPTSRVDTIVTHAGGAFYKYWVAVFGKPPPTTVAVNDPVYQDWKSGKSVGQARSTLFGSALLSGAGNLKK